VWGGVCHLVCVVCTTVYTEAGTYICKLRDIPVGTESFRSRDVLRPVVNQFLIEFLH